MGGAALIVLQALLISSLLLQRAARRHAERDLQRKGAALAHASALSVAGELTASISHEINQPLGAILSILVLIVGMLPFSLALQRTGGVDLAADAVVGVVGGAAPRFVLATLFVIMVGLGLFISTRCPLCAASSSRFPSRA